MELISVPGLTHQEQVSLDVLVNQWRTKRPRNNLRSAFYDMKNSTRGLVDKNAPATVKRREYVLGWSAMAVDKLNRRCTLDGFYDGAGNDLDSLGLSEIVRSNRLIPEVSQSGISSLIHATSFLITTKGDVGAGEPDVLIHGAPASQATGIWDRRRRLLTSFLSIHELDDKGEPVDMTMYLPNLIVHCTRKGQGWKIVRRQHQYGVPVDPLRYKQRLDREFGSSRITRTVMSLHIQALATMLRADVNGEGYSLPRYALLGATEEAFKNADGSPKPVWQAAWDAIWAIGDDLDAAGDSPALARADMKQFLGQSPEPQNAHLRMLAQMFSGETSIPIGELGLIGDANPTSAEALQTSRDDLISEAESTTDGWSPDIESAVTRALSMKNGTLPPTLDVRSKWRNPIHSSRAQAADAGGKILDKAPELAQTEVGLELLGLTPDQIKRAMIERRRGAGRALLDQVRAARADAGQ